MDFPSRHPIFTVCMSFVAVVLLFGVVSPLVGVGIVEAIKLVVR